MKRIVITILLISLLSACTAGAETVSEDISKDTQQVLTILDRLVEDEEAATEKEQEVLDRYISKYKGKEMTDEESEVFEYTETLILTTDGTLLLESDKEDYEYIKESIMNIIKTGSITGE